MITSYYQVHAQFDFDYLIEQLNDLGGSTGSTFEQVNQNILIVAEKYFIRTSSAASCTMLFTKKDDMYEIIVVISGSGQGLLNFSYGADEKYLKEIDSILLNMGAFIIEERGL